MPLNPKKELKVYYSIAEVAEMFNVNATLLRYWEKHFPQIIPKKGGRSVRQYTREEIDKIRVVYNLVKVRGMKLEAAAALIRKNKEGVERTSELIDHLRSLRHELAALRTSLGQLQ